MAQTTRVGLVQINNSFSGQNYFPYSVGILQAYAQKHLKNPERFHFMLPVYVRSGVDDALARLEGAEMVFFSTYVWNIRISLAIAAALKARKPETVVIFGGPQVPDHAEAFMRKNTCVDIG